MVKTEKGIVIEYNGKYTIIWLGRYW